MRQCALLKRRAQPEKGDNMTIFLCGFMGCGKSTVGRQLAKNLGLKFTDMDAYIVQCERMSIPDIFSIKGEEYFRKRETSAISELGSLGGVIACGGGAMLKKENAELAASFGEVVFIDLPFEDCYERIKDDHNRPIVMNNTKASLCSLYEKRQVLYSAHSGIAADGKGTPAEIAGRIAEDLKLKRDGI